MMRIPIRGGVLLLVLAVAATASAAEDELKELQSLRLAMVSLDGLARAKASLRAAGDPMSLGVAMTALGREADEALGAGPFSVMQKTRAAPSGDKHDYLSQAPYFWPNPKKKDGLPYVNRDGRVNPEAVHGSDRLALNRMATAVQTLALAYELTGEERYAKHAGRLLRAWFLDPATRMAPHLNYGQGVPGQSQGRSYGIIETRVLVYVVDAARMLESSAAWTAEDRRGMVAWCEAYLDWLRTSKHGREEESAPNNHGTWHDAQVVALALYVGQPNVARKVLEGSRERRIARHVEPDGRQPRELARTRSFFYSLVNLRALFVLATLGQRVGVDLWHYRTDDGRSLKGALDYLARYADPKETWPHKTLDFPREELVPFLQQAAAVYGEDGYRDLLGHFADGEIAASRGRLLYGVTPTSPSAAARQTRTP
jgi:hypothetical protein